MSSQRTIDLQPTALAQTVYEAALDRVRFVFDNCDDIVVSMSGGKDSTVLLHLAITVAAERGRLPVKVQWLDQEAEWQGTVDFMRQTFTRDDVIPFWFQVPCRLTSSLSGQSEWLYSWDEKARDRWIHPQDPIAITRLPPYIGDRFHQAIRWLATCCQTADKQHVGVLVGMRMVESTQRRIQLGFSGSGKGGLRKRNFKGITWSSSPVANTRVFWPIYDWGDQDVWVCIAQNDLAYNAVYDQFYRYGLTGRDMRVSSLIHENSWVQILRLQEVEPETYERFLNRVAGTSTFAHFEANEIMPSELPVAFASWKEYRDYLLEHLIEPRHQEAFRKRWRRPSLNTGDPDRWYKIHVREVMINDFEGTLSDKMRANFKLLDRRASGYYDAHHARRREALLKP
jgi:predicted phosphoadenosine phosphosulfate sulfurtransferase